MQYVVYSINDRFAELAAVSMLSVLASGNVPSAQFAIVGPRLSKAAFARIKASVPAPIRLLADKTDVVRLAATLPINSNWSEEIYYRLSVPDLLPDAGTILYLDADTLVRGDISSLFACGEGKTVGAVLHVHSAHNDRLGRPAETPYFNSGVMAIDAKRWVAKGYTKEIMRLLQDRTFDFPDQDALNVALEGDVYDIGAEFNATHTFHDPKLAKIVHFTRSKPNRQGCDHPCSGEWLNLRRETWWKDAPLLPEKKRLMERLSHSFSRRIRWLVTRMSARPQGPQSGLL